MKRVICFDLFGTLIHSTYTGTKYYELLREHDGGSSPEYVDAAIRGQLMNWDSTHWDIEGDMLYGNEEYPLERIFDVLLRQRLAASFNSNPNAHYTGPDNHRYVTTNQELVDCWLKENLALDWIEGALTCVKTTKEHLGKALLVSNITLAGECAVYDVLGRDLADAFPQYTQGCGRQRYLSCDLPVAKPDPYVWQKVQQDHPADEYWMIGNDPLIDLVMPAAMGWKTILVNHPDGVPISEVPRIIEESK